jgi:hypothetical protein
MEQGCALVNSSYSYTALSNNISFETWLTFIQIFRQLTYSNAITAASLGSKSDVWCFPSKWQDPDVSAHFILASSAIVFGFHQV